MGSISENERALGMLVALRGQEPDEHADSTDIESFLGKIKSAADMFNKASGKGGKRHIHVFPQELEYENSSKAETHLRRVQAAQSQDPNGEKFTNDELVAYVRDCGKLTDLMHSTFRRSPGTINLVAILALAPWTNFKAADRAGWIEDDTLTDEEKRAIWEAHATPGHVIVAKWEDNEVCFRVPSPVQHVLT
jgi:hypothetical protein